MNQAQGMITWYGNLIFTKWIFLNKNIFFIKMMMMTMHVGFKETIVFSGWSTTNPISFGFSCIGLFFIGFIFEALKMLRENLSKQKRFKQISKSLIKPISFNVELASTKIEPKIKRFNKPIYIKYRKLLLFSF